MPQAPTCIEHDTRLEAARRMGDLDAGALPICGADDRLHGMVTDRDIVIRCLAEDRDRGSARGAETIDAVTES